MNKQMGKHVQVKLQLLIYLSIHNQSVFVKIMTRLSPVNRRKCSSMTEGSYSTQIRCLLMYFRPMSHLCRN